MYKDNVCLALICGNFKAKVHHHDQWWRLQNGEILIRKKPYGDDFLVVKYEYVGHVLGALLCNFKKPRENNFSGVEMKPNVC